MILGLTNDLWKPNSTNKSTSTQAFSIDFVGSYGWYSIWFHKSSIVIGWMSKVEGSLTNITDWSLMTIIYSTRRILVVVFEGHFDVCEAKIWSLDVKIFVDKFNISTMERSTHGNPSPWVIKKMSLRSLNFHYR